MRSCAHDNYDAETKAGSHTVYRSTKTVDDTRDGEPPAHCGRRPRGGALLKADQREIETSRGKNDGVGTGHRIVVFFCVSCFAGKWKGKSAARGMDLIDKKGTTVPNNRLSRLQDQFKIGTRPAAGVARCRRRGCGGGAPTTNTLLPELSGCLAPVFIRSLELFGHPDSLARSKKNAA